MKLIHFTFNSEQHHYILKKKSFSIDFVHSEYSLKLQVGELRICNTRIVSDESAGNDIGAYEE